MMSIIMTVNMVHRWLLDSRLQSTLKRPINCSQTRLNCESIEGVVERSAGNADRSESKIERLHAQR